MADLFDPLFHTWKIQALDSKASVPEKHNTEWYLHFHMVITPTIIGTTAVASHIFPSQHGQTYISFKISSSHYY